MGSPWSVALLRHAARSPASGGERAQLFSSSAGTKAAAAVPSTV